MMDKKKICIITATRAEFGHLKNLLDAIVASNKLDYQMVVTGSHLSAMFGMTVDEIEKLDYHIDKKIEMIVSGCTKAAIVKSMGICQISIADAFMELEPDMVVVLGDRYELLPICSAALVMNIPIAHIAGGTVTKGAIDDEVRNAITMMSQLHFPGTESAKERIISMHINPNNVFNVGTLSEENCLKIPRIDRDTLANELGLKTNTRWITFTYHPVTHQRKEHNIEVLNTLLNEMLSYKGYEIVASFANADYGGIELNKILVQKSSEYPDKLHVFKNLGEFNYINLLRQSYAMIGNSSSGIYETQQIGLPVLNVGPRQEGRYKTTNIVDCQDQKEEIKNKIKYFMSDDISGLRLNVEKVYGDGHTSDYIVKHICDYLKNE